MFHHYHTSIDELVVYIIYFLINDLSFKQNRNIAVKWTWDILVTCRICWELEQSGMRVKFTYIESINCS